MRAKRGPGQPPKGIKLGEKVSEYHQLTIRVPDGTVALLTRLSEELGQPRWRIVHEALIAFAKGRK
jgi:hypothetical protein